MYISENLTSSCLNKLCTYQLCPRPRDPGMAGNVPGTVPGVYENIVPRYPRKYPGHSGDVTHSCPPTKRYPGPTRDVT